MKEKMASHIFGASHASRTSGTSHASRAFLLPFFILFSLFPRFSSSLLDIPNEQDMKEKREKNEERGGCQMDEAVG